jgi:hypothetical protein
VIPDRRPSGDARPWLVRAAESIGFEAAGGIIAALVVAAGSFAWWSLSSGTESIRWSVTILLSSTAIGVVLFWHWLMGERSESIPDVSVQRITGRWRHIATTVMAVIVLLCGFIVSYVWVPSQPPRDGRMAIRIARFYGDDQNLCQRVLLNQIRGETHWRVEALDDTINERDKPTRTAVEAYALQRSNEQPGSVLLWGSIEGSAPNQIIDIRINSTNGFAPPLKIGIEPGCTGRAADVIGQLALMQVADVETVTSTASVRPLDISTLNTILARLDAITKILPQRSTTSAHRTLAHVRAATLAELARATNDAGYAKMAVNVARTALEVCVDAPEKLGCAYERNGLSNALVTAAFFESGDLRLLEAIAALRNALASLDAQERADTTVVAAIRLNLAKRLLDLVWGDYSVAARAPTLEALKHVEFVGALPGNHLSGPVGALIHADVLIKHGELFANDSALSEAERVVDGLLRRIGPEDVRIRGMASELRGRISFDRGKRRIDDGLLSEAQARFESALETIDRTDEPLSWVSAKIGLGHVLVERGDITGRASIACRGIDSYLDVERHLSRGRNSLALGILRGELLKAQDALRAFDGDPDPCIQRLKPLVLGLAR